MSRHRIGHGFALSRYSALRENIVDRGALNGPSEPFLEICPISNQMLRYFTDLRTHSAYEFIKSGIQCVLGNDDPMILGNPGLSYEFWEAFAGMELDMNDIKGLVFNAYVCEILALSYYPENGETYTLNVPQLIKEFNTNYWMPFLMRADVILQEAGYVIA